MRTAYIVNGKAYIVGAVALGLALFAPHSALPAFAQSAPAAQSPGASAPKVTQSAVVSVIDLAKSLVTDHAAPGYRSFAAETAKLAAATAELCGAPSPRRLENVRNTFTAALLAWQRIQHVHFGPIMQEDRLYRIEYWPDRHGQGEKQLRKLLASAGLERFDVNKLTEASVAVQGFPALERILYASDADGLGEASSNSAPHCNLALAVSRNLAAMAKATAEAWQRDYVAPSANFSEEQAHAIATDFYKAFVEQLETVRDVKIGTPLGTSPATARPKSAEAWRSHMTERSIETNLRALSELFSGPKDGSQPGLAHMVDPEMRTSSGGPAADMRKTAAEGLTYGAEFIAQHPDLLGDPLSSEAGWKSANFLKLHLGGVRDHAVEILGPALNVSLGFNARDGD